MTADVQGILVQTARQWETIHGRKQQLEIKEKELTTAPSCQDLHAVDGQVAPIGLPHTALIHQLQQTSRQLQWVL